MRNAPKADATTTTTTTTTTTVVVNGETIVIDNNQPLDKLIDNMVEAETKAYGSHILIAAKLNDLMTFDWYDIANEERSDNATIFAPYWKAVYDGIKRTGHKNASVPGKRIRDYGRNLRAGLAPNGKTMADGSPLPEGEGAGEGANPAKRSDMLVAVEDGTKYFKRMHKSTNPELVAYAEEFAALMKKHLKFDVRLAK
jgi:hypothetical protein